MAQLETIIAELDYDVKGLKSLERANKELEKQLKISKDLKKSELDRQQASNRATVLQKRINTANGEFNKGLSSSNKALNTNKLSIQSLARTAVPALAAVFAIDKITKFVGELRRVDKEYNNLSRSIKRFSNLSGFQNTDVVIQAKALEKVYGESAENIIKATNSFAKQMKISFNEAFVLVEKGFLKGANAQGKFLENLKQYPVQFREAKLSAEEFIKIATQEANGGVFNDKLLDSVKELGLRVRELAKSSLDALKPLGKEFSTQLIVDLNSGNKDIIEIFNGIIKKANEAGLDTQKLQTIVADLGGGPVEDVGGLREAFEQLNAAMKINLDTLDEQGKAEQRALESARELTTANAALAETFKGIDETITTLSNKTEAYFKNTLSNVFDLQRAYVELFGVQGASDEAIEKLFKFGETSSGKSVKKVLEDTFGDQFATNVKDNTKLIEEFTKAFQKEGESIKDINKILPVYFKLRNDFLKKQPKATVDNSLEAVVVTPENTEEERKKATEARIKAIEKEKRALKEFAELSQQIGFSAKEAQANLSDSFTSATLRAEVELDKLTNKYEENIKRIKELGKAAGKAEAEINLSLSVAEQEYKDTAQAITQNLKKELEAINKSIGTKGKGLISLESLFDLDSNIEGLGGNQREVQSQGLQGVERNNEITNTINAGEQLLNSDRESLAARKELYNDFYDSIKQAALEFTDYQISELDREIDYRQGRMAYLSNLQDVSAEEALKAEQQNIDKALQQRKKFQEQQKVIALLEAGINITAGIAKVFAQNGAASLGTLPVILGVLTATLAGVPAILNSVVGYKDGGEVKGGRNQLVRINEEGTEFVLKAKAYKDSPQLADMINKGLLTDKDLYNMNTFANVTPIVEHRSNQSSTHRDSKELKEIKGLLYGILQKQSPSYETNMNVDEKGIYAMTTKINRKQTVLNNRR